MTYTVVQIAGRNEKQERMYTKIHYTQINTLVITFLKCVVVTKSRRNI